MLDNEFHVNLDHGLGSCELANKATPASSCALCRRCSGLWGHDSIDAVSSLVPGEVSVAHDCASVCHGLRSLQTKLGNKPLGFEVDAI